MSKSGNNNIISGMPSNARELTIHKSTPLLSLWNSGFSLAEFKLLDVYLSRINSHDSVKRTVVLQKGELECLLGVQKINLCELKKRLKNLMTVVEIREDRTVGKEKIVLVSLFEKCEAFLDDDGQWTVQMMCTSSAQKYFFNVESLGYLRYKLRNIVRITSRYTYIMYLYLESNRFRGTWEESVISLKEILKCDDAVYMEYKFFNQKILSRVQKELAEKTECRFEYEPIRHHRKVDKIRFSLAPAGISDNRIIAENSDLVFGPEAVPLNPSYGISDDNAIFYDLLGEVFTKEEIDDIVEHVRLVPEHILPMVDNATGKSHSDLLLRRYHYMAQMYSRFRRYDANRKISNKAGYIISMIDQTRESY